jgi:hypothetical protein
MTVLVRVLLAACCLLLDRASQYWENASCIDTMTTVTDTFKSLLRSVLLVRIVVYERLQQHRH